MSQCFENSTETSPPFPPFSSVSAQLWLVKLWQNPDKVLTTVSIPMGPIVSTPPAVFTVNLAFDWWVCPSWRAKAMGSGTTRFLSVKVCDSWLPISQNSCLGCNNSRVLPSDTAEHCPALNQTGFWGGSLNCSHPISTFSYNSTCEFFCDDGYELAGQNQIRCDHTGQWTPGTPACSGELTNWWFTCALFVPLTLRRSRWAFVTASCTGVTSCLGKF